MVFFKYSIVMAVLATGYGALLPSPVPYAAAPVPYPTPYAHPHVHHVPPPPPPPPQAYHVAPHHAAQVVPIVSQSYDASPDGSYQFQYEAGDGSQRQEQGVPKYGHSQDGSGGVAVQGRFAYASPEGPVQVEYIADENGYQPSGSHIHPEIIKAVAAQVAFARSEGPVAYHAQPYHHAPPPPPPPPAVPVPAVYQRAYPGPPPAVTYAPFPFKA